MTIGEVIYWLIAHTLAIQFKDTFTKHFNPHQFKVAMLRKCETMVHVVKTMLDLHLEWVVLQVDVQNMFNSISQIAIFQDLCSCTSTLD
jgi:hypothetical protein